jgi:hypothetical protein
MLFIIFYKGVVDVLVEGIDRYDGIVMQSLGLA